ncbi:hypothetical protein D1007_40101 [Hordeum vulgare]|nr:hypothetical protein D1007_40101 [Hordeum vulgare]
MLWPRPPASDHGGAALRQTGPARDSTISIKIKVAGGGHKKGFHNWLHCLKEKNSYMILVTARFADVFAPCFQAKL